jgi:hypothetical protein
MTTNRANLCAIAFIVLGSACTFSTTTPTRKSVTSFPTTAANSEYGEAIPEMREIVAKEFSQVRIRQNSSDSTSLGPPNTLEIVRVEPATDHWSIHRHDESGAVLGRNAALMVGARAKDGTCILFRPLLRQDYVEGDWAPLHYTTSSPPTDKGQDLFVMERSGPAAATAKEPQPIYAAYIECSALGGGG